MVFDYSCIPPSCFPKTPSFREQENSPSYQAPLRVAQSVGEETRGLWLKFAGPKSSNQQQSLVGFISIIIITIIIIIITY